MNERTPKAESSEPHPRVDAEVISRYFEANGVKKFDVTSWQPGDPVLSILPDAARNNLGPFAEADEPDRPHFALVHAPSAILTPNEPASLEDYTVSYDICNEHQSQVDYYVLDAIDQRPRLVRSTNSFRPPHNPYLSDSNSLYDGKDFINKI